MVHRYLSIILFLSFTAPCFPHPADKPEFKTSIASGFIENKGQIIDQNNKPNPSVLFLLNTPGLNVQLRKSGFSYDVYSLVFNTNLHPKVTNDSLVPKYKVQRIDIDFQNINPSSTIETSVSSTEYLNYYTLGLPPEGVTSVRSFNTVTYKDIYPGIDLQFICNKDRLFEYTFILQPGAEIASIKFKVSGPQRIRKFKDGIQMETTVGDIEEEIPVCFYSFNNQKVSIKGKFRKIGNNLYGFSIEKVIPNNAVLVIDPVPTRIWGTYYGGYGNDKCWNIKINSENDLIVSGYTTSPTNIATTGSFQQIYGGGDDGLVAKFSNSGQLMWGTYFGGVGNESLNTLDLSADNFIYVAGTTSSTSNISTIGSFKPALSGPTDGFLEKFSSSGQRIWGTYFGGSSDDQILFCKVKGASYISVVKQDHRTV